MKLGDTSVEMSASHHELCKYFSVFTEKKSLQTQIRSFYVKNRYNLTHFGVMKISKLSVHKRRGEYEDGAYSRRVPGERVPIPYFTSQRTAINQHCG